MNDTAQLAANAIRVLSMDAVQKANSGHPGMPMGMADIATVLWGKYLNVDPTHPEWPDRDRFIVSNGHGSMLLYSVLHFAGFPLPMEAIENFRQWGYPTAGHPEIELELGIEMTTGPLGQGFATAAGMALAEAHLRQRLGADLVDHWTYVFCSDGDLMEGVAAEAASLAGHLGLGRMIYLYDDNDISLEGPTSWTFTEDVGQRFAAYGWHTLETDGHDQDAIDEAIAEARRTVDRPSLICCKTTIGYGSPNAGGTAKAHGSPLGDDEIDIVRRELGWEHPPFIIPDAVYRFFGDAMERGKKMRQEWDARLQTVLAAGGELADSWRSHAAPREVALDPPDVEPGSNVATRALSGHVIQQLAELRPDVLSGDADLAGSTKSDIESSADLGPRDHGARNVRYGVREHAMGAMVNGMTIHGGVRPFSSTFLQFSDYMRPALRLAALMEIPSVHVFTHDSVFLGEDGPTHQPIEHLPALRAIPNLWVVRPGEHGEVAGAWQLAMNRTQGPTALVFSRQGVPIPSEPVEPSQVALGGYVVEDGDDLAIIATGSELWVAKEAAAQLRELGHSVRVVSMPCVEAFRTRDAAYRESVLGSVRLVTLEAAATFGWADIAGPDALHIGIDHFGASAPWKVLAEQYGLTADAVAARIAEWLVS